MGFYAKTLGFVLAVLAVAVPAALPAASEMSAMQYYVGRWSCSGGPPAEARSKAEETFTLSAGLLSQHVVVAPSGAMRAPFALDTSTAWDAKNHRYVLSGIRADAHWWASTARPWAGNTERWNDIVSSHGQPGRETVVRTNRDAYAYTIYSPAGSAVFFSTCRRSRT